MAFADVRRCLTLCRQVDGVVAALAKSRDFLVHFYFCLGNNCIVVVVVVATEATATATLRGSLL